MIIIYIIWAQWVTQEVIQIEELGILTLQKFWEAIEIYFKN